MNNVAEQLKAAASSPTAGEECILLEIAAVEIDRLEKEIVAVNRKRELQIVDSQTMRLCEQYKLDRNILQTKNSELEKEKQELYKMYQQAIAGALEYKAILMALKESWERKS